MRAAAAAAAALQGLLLLLCMVCEKSVAAGNNEITDEGARTQRQCYGGDVNPWKRHPSTLPLIEPRLSSAGYLRTCA